MYVQVAGLLDLEVDLRSSTRPRPTSSWRTPTRRPPELARQRASGDDADPGKAAGFRTHGKSKDSRDDLPQIVIGMAVIRQAIPVRVWCWPGTPQTRR